MFAYYLQLGLRSLRRNPILTALMVAGWRAVHAVNPDPLVTDPYAKVFIAASGDPYWTGQLADPPSSEHATTFPRLYGVQTRFFDDFFVAATGAGIRQAVIVAAGLDSRAYRLRWPAGTTVFEVDQPEVLEFKSRVLAEHGAEIGNGHFHRLDQRRAGEIGIGGAHVGEGAEADWTCVLRSRARQAGESGRQHEAAGTAATDLHDVPPENEGLRRPCARRLVSRCFLVRCTRDGNAGARAGGQLDASQR